MGHVLIHRVLVLHLIMHAFTRVAWLSGSAVTLLMQTHEYILLRFLATFELL